MTGASRLALALRGLLAAIVIVVVSGLLVLKGGGGLHNNPEVLVSIPASAGLISGEAPVRYAGVNVGRIGGIESGAQASIVRLEVNSADIANIPANVQARVVPRTFFGDIYIQLVDSADSPSPVGLRSGDHIMVDTGPESVALYGVFEKVANTLAAMQPEKMQTALTALSQALDGRGAAIGETIDNLSDAAGTVTPALREFVEATPEFTTVLAGLEEAAPDVLGLLAAATTVSQNIVDNQDGIANTLAAAAGYADAASPFIDAKRGEITTVLNSAGIILATTGANSAGLTETLTAAHEFGLKGGKVFATGKFNITTVATFQDPLPYSAADCPVYVGTANPGCAAHAAAPGSSHPVGLAPTLEQATDLTVSIPVVDARGEAPVLRALEDSVRGQAAGPDADTAPNPATVTLLGPLVRGNEVEVR